MGIMWGSQPRFKQSPAELIRPASEGINTQGNIFEISKGECSKCLNISNRNYPAISTRPGRTKEFGTATSVITKCNAAGARLASIAHVLDGTVWKYWNVATSAWINVATGVTDATGKFLEFGTAADKFTLLINGTYKKAWNGSGSPTDLTGAPATKLMCTDDYRLYALHDNIIKASAGGSVTDWTTLDDAWQEPLAGMIGVGTAITAFNDMVIAFSDQTMHILMGNNAADSTLLDPTNCGCISDKSIVKYDGVLFFMDYYKFKAFTGGIPVDISQKVSKYLDEINYTYKNKIVAGNWGKYIYLSIPYGAGVTENTITLEYNTELRIWFAWDMGFVDFINIGEFLYGVDVDGVAWKMQQGTADVAAAIGWSFETGVWNALPVRPKKTISNYFALMNLPVGSTCKIEYSITSAGEDWATLHTFTASAVTQNVPVMIPTTILQNVNFYRLKFSGTGPMDLYYIETDVRVKSR